MNALVVAFVSLFIGFPQPESITIPKGYTRQFLADARETRRTGNEVVYCLHGYEEDGDYRITGVVKPPQVVYHKTVIVIDDGIVMWGIESGVTYTPCGIGTVMDLHTHPFDNPEPSDTDTESWEAYPYHLHGIVTETFDGRVVLEVWNRLTGEPLQKVRTVP